MCFMMVFSNQPLLVLINKVITNKRAHNTLFGSYIYISAWLPMVFSYVSFIRIGSGRHLELHHQWSLSYWKWRVRFNMFSTCWCCKSTRDGSGANLERSASDLVARGAKQNDNCSACIHLDLSQVLYPFKIFSKPLCLKGMQKASFYRQTSLGMAISSVLVEPVGSTETAHWNTV